MIKSLVILETPYAGSLDEIEKHKTYARMCMRDCLLRGEAPFASHLLYTQANVLNDHVPEERDLGVEAGLKWGSVADKTVVYTDLGVSAGMKMGIDRAREEDRQVEMRTLEYVESGSEIYIDEYATPRSIFSERFDELYSVEKNLFTVMSGCCAAMCARSPKCHYNLSVREEQYSVVYTIDMVCYSGATAKIIEVAEYNRNLEDSAWETCDIAIFDGKVIKFIVFG